MNSKCYLLCYFHLSIYFVMDCQFRVLMYCLVSRTLIECRVLQNSVNNRFKQKQCLNILNSGYALIMSTKIEATRLSQLSFYFLLRLPHPSIRHQEIKKITQTNKNNTIETIFEKCWSTNMNNNPSKPLIVHNIYE